MHIIHTIPALTIEGGGGNRACAELAESQAALGHQVTILHLADKKELFAPKGVNTIQCQADSGVLGSRFGYSYQMERELEKVLPAADILHIHALWRHINVSGMRVAQQVRIPYVLQPHGSLHPWKLKHKKIIKYIWGRLFERQVIAGAAALHAECESDKKDIYKYSGHHNIFVVPCGAYARNFLKPKNKMPMHTIWPKCKDKKIILYLARVDVNKGIDLLIETIANLSDRLCDYHILIIGPDYGGTTEKMKKFSIQKGIENYITWAGMVSEEFKRMAFHGADLYVLPSLSENFGISVLEALFCKVPVITTTETAWTSLSSINGGIIVKPTSKDLITGFKKFLSLNENERINMAENGYMFVKNTFEWESVAKQTIKEYESVISGYTTRDI